MATIQYAVNRDANGNATVTFSVQSIGPGDQVTFVTDTLGTAISCKGGSPFARPAANETYKVPPRSAQAEPLQVTNSPEGCQWVCGQIDDSGNFTPWPGEGPQFPPVKSDGMHHSH